MEQERKTWNQALSVGIFLLLLTLLGTACSGDDAQLTDGDWDSLDKPTDGDDPDGDDPDGDDPDGDDPDGDDPDGDDPDGDDPDGDDPDGDKPDGDTDGNDIDGDTDGDDTDGDTDGDDTDGDEPDGDAPPCPDWDGNPDLPDPDFIDNDCDGIDGSSDEAIFVDPVNGNDMNDGTLDYPVLTPAEGVERAAEFDPPKHVYLALGTYTEPIVLADGVSLYGGFDPEDGWQRTAAYSEIHINDIDATNNMRAIIADGFQLPVDIAFLAIRLGSNQQSEGGSVYGVWVNNSRTVRVHHCQITTGDGAPGRDGQDGTAGAGQKNGKVGSNAYQDAWPHDDNGPQGGQAGALACGDVTVSGGRGGNSGWGSSSDDPNGDNGVSPFGGAAFGPGSNSTHGGDGGDGEAGQHGQDGLGGNGAGLVGEEDGLWTGSAGLQGTDGQPGMGGGGGGGGGGSDGGTWLSAAWGGAGGGGGAGGCGGTRGHGGGGGGASIGVFYNASPAFVFECTITVGNGGRGGHGGQNGTGGLGGNGAEGGGKWSDSDLFGNSFASGTGGAGGDGGDGGRGGNGGGGGGGISFGIYAVREPLDLVGYVEDNLITSGQGGIGGVSAASSPTCQGESGAFGDSYRESLPEE